MPNKHPGSELRKNYPLLFEAGVICSLLLFIFAMKFNIPDNHKNTGYNFETEDPPIVLPPITQTKKTPPSPLHPQVPNVVPDDSPLDIEPINFPDFGNPDDGPLPLPPDEKGLSDAEDQIMDFVQIMPELKGGIKAFYQDLVYPEAARRSGIEGTVVVEFIVNKQGKIEDPKIIRGIGGGCNEEVLKAIKKQTFTPGIQGGNFVKVRMSQNVRFKLNN